MSSHGRQSSIALVLDKREAVFDCQAEETVMDAAARKGICMANYCKQGGCGACTSKLISGQVEYIRKIKGAPQDPVEGDLIRPCSCLALTDLVLEPRSPWKHSS